MATKTKQEIFDAIGDFIGASDLEDNALTEALYKAFPDHIKLVDQYLEDLSGFV